MASLSENIKPVQRTKTSVTDGSWKAIINRHLRGSRNILIQYTVHLRTRNMKWTAQTQPTTHTAWKAIVLSACNF
jgi:hypothetical protein